MKTVSFKGTMNEAYGEPLPAPLSFEGTFKAYETKAEIHESEMPDDEALLKLVNDKRKASAVQAARNAKLEAEGIDKPTAKTSVDVRINTIKRMLLADPDANHTEESALAAAKAVLGIQ